MEYSLQKPEDAAVVPTSDSSTEVHGNGISRTILQLQKWLQRHLLIQDSYNQSSWLKCCLEMIRMVSMTGCWWYAHQRSWFHSRICKPLCLKELWTSFYHLFKALRDINNNIETRPIQYKFSEVVLEAFGNMQNRLQAMKADTNEENKHGHVIKTITHLVRLSEILFVMEQGFNALAENRKIEMDM